MVRLSRHGTRCDIGHETCKITHCSFACNDNQTLLYMNCPVERLTRRERQATLQKIKKDSIHSIAKPQTTKQLCGLSQRSRRTTMLCQSEELIDLGLNTWERCFREDSWSYGDRPPNVLLWAALLSVDAAALAHRLRSSCILELRHWAWLQFAHPMSAQSAASQYTIFAFLDKYLQQSSKPINSQMTKWKPTIDRCREASMIQQSGPALNNGYQNQQPTSKN